MSGAPLPNRDGLANRSPSRLPTKPTLRSAAGLSRASNTQDPSRPPLSRANLTKALPRASADMSSSRLRRNSAATTVSTAASTTAKSAASSTRPPSSTSSKPPPSSKPPVASSKHIRNVSTSAVPPSARVRAPSLSHLPSVSHARNKSSSAMPPPGTTAIKPPSSTLESSRRPNFSTLQQHYSPAKNTAPKPSTASFLVPPTPSKLPSNIAISAETARLQAELLQLHVLHRSAPEVTEQWHGSVYGKLGAKVEEVKRAHADLDNDERERVRRKNADALRNWSSTGTIPFDEMVQVLDRVVSAVWNEGENGGKFDRMVRKFERWLGKTQEVWKSRRQLAVEGSESCDMLFVEPLGDSWKRESLSLETKLGGWREELYSVGKAKEGSNLAGVIDGCTALVNGMRSELQAMRMIEKEVFEEESIWVRKMNDEAVDEAQEPPPAGGAWRNN